MNFFNRHLTLLYLAVLAFVFSFCEESKAQLHASDFCFTQLDVRDGLSENNVKSIVQDFRGFMWFGTKNGLNRYDGVNFKHYSVDDVTSGAGNHNVSALMEDSKHQLWVGTDKGVFIFNPDTELFSFFDLKAENADNSSKGQGRITDWISQIVTDKRGNIWIISPTEGAYKYNPTTGKMRQYTTESKSNNHHNMECICVTAKGDVWIGTSGSGLLRYDDKHDTMARIVKDSQGTSLADKNIFVLCEYGDRLAIGEHEDKLLAYDPKANLFSEISQQVNYKIIRSLLYDGNRLYVGTQAGLFVIADNGDEIQLRENAMQPGTLSDNIIYSLYQDRNKGLWLGTAFNGVNYMPHQGVMFRNYLPLRGENTLTSRSLREMCADKLGRVWIGSEEGTLQIYNHGKFTSVPVPTYKGGMNRLGLMADGDYVWSGIFKNGIDIINIHTFALTHYTPAELGLGHEGSVYAILRDSHGNVWIGTGNGLCKKRADSMVFDHVKSLENLFVQDVVEDNQGKLWIATMGGGLFHYDPATDSSTHYTTTDGNLPSNSISSITIAPDGTLWLATDRGGIAQINATTGEVHAYSLGAGLPDDVAYRILIDHKGNLWFGTNQGLVRFNHTTGNVTTYRNTNGLAGNQYNYKSALITSDGEMLFGGVSGLVAYRPAESETDATNQKVYITNIRVDDQEIRPEVGGIIETNILSAQSITLPHDMSNLAFDVSSLNLGGVEHDSYEYRMEGVDKDWMNSPGGKSIFYSHLQPGTYKLHVRVKGNTDDGTTLTVVVRSPWYATTLAQIIYLLLILAMAWMLYRCHQKRQARLMHMREQRCREAKDREVLSAKINFFTDVTHEIRTPLALINGAVENLFTISATSSEHNTEEQKNLNAISKNTNRLLNLVNQLLDLRKLRMNTMTLYFTRVDICQMVRDMVERFEPAVAHENKTITLTTSHPSIVMPIDQEAVTKTISNLLNNARKYSESWIKVSIDLIDDHLTVTIDNDGPQIPASKADIIFTPFERLESSVTTSGSGIGLPLARSLAELHHGSLTLDTTAPCNRFVLTLPTTQDDVIELESNETPEEEAPAPLPTVETSAEMTEEELDNLLPTAAVKEYTVLVVEDNTDLRTMLREKFSRHYNVLTAQNGQEGLDTMRAQHVDIVVSDIRMPVMDGLKMTEILKSDIEINHIPIVLLTARTTMPNRLEGLRAGADAYIEKPFSTVHMLQQVATLLENRKRERASFLHKPYLPVQNSSVNKQEEEFLQRMTAHILEHVSEPEFNVERLAQDMCMSRSSLHRKIKDTCDLTPIDFIRLIRLKKAAELIREKNYRTTEVCEMVGITSPSYFIKLFSKQFGMTPKEFADAGKKKNADKAKED